MVHVSHKGTMPRGSRAARAFPHGPGSVGGRLHLHGNAHRIESGAMRRRGGGALLVLLVVAACSGGAPPQADESAKAAASPTVDMDGNVPAPRPTFRRAPPRRPDPFPERVEGATWRFVQEGRTCELPRGRAGVKRACCNGEVCEGHCYAQIRDGREVSARVCACSILYVRGCDAGSECCRFGGECAPSGACPSTPPPP